MAAPKRRTSKMKQRSRLAAQAWKAPKLGKCPQCGTYKTQSGAEVIVKLVD